MAGELILGSWQGVWELGWTALAALPAAPTESSERFCIFRHNAATGLCEVVLAGLRDGRWGFAPLASWKKPEQWHAAAALPSSEGGGLIVLMRTGTAGETAGGARWAVIPVSPDGLCGETAEGDLRGTWSLIAPCGSDAVLLYDAASGEAELRRVAPGCVEEEAVAAADIGTGWSAVVGKEAAAERRRSQGDGGVFRFLCYSAEQGVSRLRKLRVGGRQQQRYSTASAVAATSPQGKRRKKGCSVAAVTLRGEPCLLFYRHTPPPPPGDAAEGSAQPEAPGSPQPGVLLARRIACHRVRWSALLPLERRGGTAGFLLCYSQQDGALWICTLAATTEQNAADASPRRESAAAESLLFGASDGVPSLAARHAAPTPPPIWPGLGSGRAPSPPQPAAEALHANPPSPLPLAPLSDELPCRRRTPRCQTAHAPRRPWIGSPAAQRPWTAPPAEDPRELASRASPAPAQPGLQGYRAELAGILSELRNTPFGQATGYAATALRMVAAHSVDDPGASPPPDARGQPSADSRRSSGEAAAPGSQQEVPPLLPQPPPTPVVQTRPRWRVPGAPTAPGFGASPPRLASSAGGSPRRKRTRQMRQSAVARLIRPRTAGGDAWRAVRIAELQRAVVSRRRRPPLRLREAERDKRCHKMYSLAARRQQQRERARQEGGPGPPVRLGRRLLQRLTLAMQEDSNQRMFETESKRRAERAAERRKNEDELTASLVKQVPPLSRETQVESANRLSKEGMKSREAALERAQKANPLPLPCPSGRQYVFDAAQWQELVGRLYSKE
eukprot:TRINITY_DN47333_c0_g1_i1.p1 TRINITY_DN47333_c0_g1~~TRINITY_DN47333_c0_g1_i1.p1  ORF type:complete len:787 (+),score=98.78 TRINITY_DN47333_c0_g1_i1:84-2444(+)